jgi:hypothetical protein
LAALTGLGAAPFILLHAYSTFQSYISQGGCTAGFAWTALLALYYLMARTALDVCRDCLDYIQGQYRTACGDWDSIDQRRKKEPPFDFLSNPGIRRAFSNWQYAMMGWAFFEIIIGWIAFLGMFYALFHSPYLIGLRPPVHSVDHAVSTNELTWFLLKMSSFLTVAALYSAGYRWDLGIMPLVQRMLGAPDTYPGQNKFPKWINEYSIRLFGRPM